MSKLLKCFFPYMMSQNAWKSILSVSGITTPESHISHDEEGMEYFKEVYKMLKHHDYSTFLIYYKIILKQIAFEPLERNLWGIVLDIHNKKICCSKQTIHDILDTFFRNKHFLINELNGHIHFCNDITYWKFKNKELEIHSSDIHLFREILATHRWVQFISG